MGCDNHPSAESHAGHCPACLLEEALAAAGATGDSWPAAPAGGKDAPFGRFSILLPLGQSESGAVYLVRRDTPPGGLFRLKTWRAPAEPGFLERFRSLQAQLGGWHEPAIEPPLAARIDAVGCPSVLSRFRRGMPVLDQLRSGAINSEAALALILPLREILRKAHTRGLAHGSIVPGNVTIDAGGKSARLLDFGMKGLLRPSAPLQDLMTGDRTGLAILEHALSPGAGQ